MSPAYAAARIPQITLMMRRLTDAKTEDLRRSLIDPLSGRSLGERGALFALRRNNEINDTISKLASERIMLERISV